MFYLTLLLRDESGNSHTDESKNVLKCSVLFLFFSPHYYYSYYDDIYNVHINQGNKSEYL